jgi:outer membrane protein OmpA-like peptidoglycan-associated protein
MENEIKNIETGKEVQEVEEITSSEKRNLPLIVALWIGGLILVVLLLFVLIYRKNKKSITEVKEAVAPQKVVVEKFFYEISPFPNRSANIKKLTSKIDKLKEELEKVLKNLPKDKKIKVYGHTSREKVKPDKLKEEGNLVLSTERAKAVINYLHSKYGIDKNLFEIIPMGSKELKVKKPTWSEENRRVEIKVE